MATTYEVIRLIQQNSGGHIIMDCVEGEILGEYILRNPDVDKNLMFSWFTQLIAQLKCIERIKGISEYRYLSPFYIILKSDRAIALMNLKSKMNQKSIDRVSQYSIMNKFYPEDGKYSDIYSFGKTIQFLLAKTNLNPHLSMHETAKIKYIISKCISQNYRKQYKSFQEIDSEFPIQKKKTKIMSVGIFMVLTLAAIFYINKNPERTENNVDERIELGIIHFSVLEEYDKCLQIMEQIKKSEKAEFYRQLCLYMLEMNDKSSSDIQKMFIDYEEKNEFTTEEKNGLIKVLAKIDSHFAREKIKEYAQSVLNESETYKQLKLREILAGIYYQEKDYDAALTEMEDFLGEINKEEIYDFMILLYEKCNMKEDALEICEAGLQMHEDSLELTIQFIRLICQNKSFTKEEKQRGLNRIIAMKDILEKDKRYLALKKEYGIHIEGNTIRLE